MASRTWKLLGATVIGLATLASGQASAAPAEPPPSAQVSPADRIKAERSAMAKLEWMDGEWQGLAITQTPTGEHRVTQTERIGPLLDGTIKLVEGRGFNPDGTKGFNAFGVISFDPDTAKFTFRSYAQGQAGTFDISPQGTGYVWQIPAGPMTIRYTATLQDGTWKEIGERILPGRPPVRFFEMNLRRRGDAAWPEAGALNPR